MYVCVYVCNSSPLASSSEGFRKDFSAVVESMVACFSEFPCPEVSLDVCVEASSVPLERMID